MFHSIRKIFAVFTLLLFVPIILSAQTNSYLEGQDSIEIKNIEFKGNNVIKTDVLKTVIRSKETSSKYSQFIYRIVSEKLGSKPEYYNSDILVEDIKQLQVFYKRSGYYHSVISYDTFIDQGRKGVNILFNIEENRQSYIDSIVYEGLEKLPQGVQSQLFKEPIIKKGTPYFSEKASAEIGRVLDFLSNNGYPAARYDSENSGAYEFMSTHNFFLKFVFIIGTYCTFGDATIKIDPPRKDLVDKLVIRHLDFKSGEMYNREKINSSERNLNRLAIFESARIDHPSVINSSSSSILPVEIFIRPRAKNEISPEFIVSDEGGYFNLGLGLGYTNRNFFGDARTFSANLRIRTQDIQRWNFDDVFGVKGLRDLSVKGAIELQFQVLQPYFFTRSLSASWTSSVSAEKQELYILSILRNRIGFSNQFATYTYGYLDWTLERVRPDILQDTVELESVLKVLRQEDQPQFNSILTLTLQRDKTNDVFSPTEGFFNSISIEESGILPKYLPSIRSGLPFTQYYKFTLLGRWYRDLTWRRFNILAWKLKSGYQNKYGESKYSQVSIPLNRRFFAGGSGSVRGWNARELGAMPSELIQFGGNFVFEGNVEMRVSHFQGWGKFGFINLENILGVYFLDFGNIWSDITKFAPKDIAVGAGFGLRYVTFFGPFRLDYGMRLHDPLQREGKRTVFQKRFFAETLSDGVLHFGIGHAF
ncbi:MAG: BamA/TamA family outer membrane protein [Bacteroidota bacterium]|nr:BamA/TamA family outer membrane protein [Bacteroidota bacterium]